MAATFPDPIPPREGDPASLMLTDVNHQQHTLASLLAGRRVLVLILRHAF